MLAVVAVDLGMVLAWTTWWHLGTFSGDDRPLSILWRTVEFLGWTFLPCCGLAAALMVLSTPLMKRTRPRSRSWVQMLLTLAAPVLWAVVYCWRDDNLGYLPTAALVAEGAWIVTLQPLWTYLVVLRIDRGRE